ncbi:MAG: 7-carboxy-7-deazaguanine synthase QueE [Prevotella sp.]|nr:7-carboxy-7-deazaguanine synthase QueE [Prevotella sp.]
MYRVNEIFYSLQGEGRHTGRAAVFVRFSGCNLRCPFCDTAHDSFRQMSAADIVQAIATYPARFVVLTGGEPALQADEPLTDALHAAGYTIAIETNGTHTLPKGIDWVTLSPKAAPVVLRRCNELKLLFLSPSFRPDTQGIDADYYYLQPCDTGDARRNRLIIEAATAYVLQHPEWRLSLQTHKLAGFR